MGSKTPEHGQRGPDAPSASSVAGNAQGTKPAGSGGLILDDLGGDDEDGDGDGDGGLGLNEQQDKPKKRKNKKKKKTKKTPKEQSSPPRVLLATLFPDEKYPHGELVDYAEKSDNLQRTTAEEVRHMELVDSMDDDFLKDYRHAAEIHRQVRSHAQQILKPGANLTDVALEIEEGVRALTGHQGIEPGDPLIAGMGFPTGLCLNNVAAHWTPNAGAKDVILKHEDVLSVDFGVHVAGRIVDSAFTVAFDTKYDNLLAAVKDATDTGLREAGIDARISHISGCIQEAMESYEIELNGKTIPIKAMRSLTGHDIKRYRIHGDKQIPFVKTKTNQRMEEGEVFAIETFGTTGKAWTRDDVGVYGYGRNEAVSASGLHHPSAKALLKTIEKNFGPLNFARRYLERLGVEKYHLPMKTLVDHGIMNLHAPLVDVPGSYVAQFEHTILLRPNCKEIISRGDDY